ncbi:hypothetical protein CEW88_07250 [Alloyangia pacifica]|uniref:Uncharacterized protein n=1 Tax=Alloyangia pacifica TaxID=311180 RepID=A0A2U8HCI8_9RHOB|nr:hypothetical protein [Alloyangia pacifica]AWI83488.1 hypothetical protein CEW88_07250 [Alloyangia pacifica]
MTSLDLAYSCTRRPAISGGFGAIIAALALVVLLGLPALTAPERGAATLDWHGNSASHQRSH